MIYLVNYINAWKKCVLFQGRSSRREYWSFYLINAIISSIALVIDNVFDLNIKPFYSRKSVIGLVFIVYALVSLLPSIAVFVRRLHDIGKPFGWIFLSFLPIVGSIILLVWLCRKGDKGENKYGEEVEECEVLEKYSDVYIVIVILWLVLESVLSKVLNLLMLKDNVTHYVQSDLYYAYSTFSAIVVALIPILFALTIKNHRKKVVLLVIATIFAVIHYIYVSVYLYLK